MWLSCYWRLVVFTQRDVTKPNRGCFCYHGLSLYSLHPFLSLCQSGRAPVDLGVSVMGVGSTGPLQSTSPKPHQASCVVEQCISLSRLSLWLSWCETSSPCELVTWFVCCGLGSGKQQTVCYWIEGKSYVSSLNLQPQLEAAVAVLSLHIGVKRGRWIYGLRLRGDHCLMWR